MARHWAASGLALHSSLRSLQSSRMSPARCKQLWGGVGKRSSALLCGSQQADGLLSLHRSWDTKCGRRPELIHFLGGWAFKTVVTSVPVLLTFYSQVKTSALLWSGGGTVQQPCGHRPRHLPAAAASQQPPSVFPSRILAPAHTASRRPNLLSPTARIIGSPFDNASRWKASQSISQTA